MLMYPSVHNEIYLQQKFAKIVVARLHSLMSPHCFQQLISHTRMLFETDLTILSQLHRPISPSVGQSDLVDECGTSLQYTV